MRTSMRFLAFGTLLATSTLLAGCTGQDTGSIPVSASPTASIAPSASSSTATTPTTPTTPAPTATPPAPTVTETPAPVATESATDVVLLEVGTEQFDLLARDGTVEDFTYFDSVDSVVDRLSDVFGSAPTVENVVPEFEPGPSTTYTWPGFVLQDPDSAGDSPYYPEFFLRVTALDSNGLPLATVDGIRVGDPGADIIAQYPDDQSPYTSTTSSNGTYVRVNEVFLPANDEYPTGEASMAVGILIPETTGVVGELRAPAPNFGQ